MNIIGLHLHILLLITLQLYLANFPFSEYVFQMLVI